ncbi:hypothetical protein SADUNF_Sadunf04G0016700 [Salix dunnii]|uniref:Uncharacterized protein n=1 Tax=Salix dunnii TaxID=1413687 RepID=A0A835N3U4_9ROSI|nr:hypothetical protein SADUNF_Sadunf04G0016700 [Salix dunnii]
MRETSLDENQDGNDGSYLECYTREHPSIAAERASEQVSQLICDAWKKRHGECLYRPGPFSSIFTKAGLNVARSIPLMYSYDDSPSHESLKELMRSLAAHQKTLSRSPCANLGIVFGNVKSSSLIQHGDSST